MCPSGPFGPTIWPPAQFAFRLRPRSSTSAEPPTLVSLRAVDASDTEPDVQDRSRSLEYTEFPLDSRDHLLAERAWRAVRRPGARVPSVHFSLGPRVAQPSERRPAAGGARAARARSGGAAMGFGH